MTPFDQFKSFHGTAWPNKLADYLNNGWVYSSPSCFALVGIELTGETWFVDYLAGDVKEAIHHLPFYLPYVVFNRKGKTKLYATATITRRFLKDDSVKI